MSSSLKDVLNGVYNTVDLSTAQTCVCNCCKIAMPQINYCEFLNIVTEYWNTANQEDKLTVMLTCIDYFFKVQFENYGIQTLVKPCVFLNKADNLCKIYENRPVSCRMYGLWPKEEYESRVARFEKAYSKFGLSKEDLPLHKQCDKVVRVDNSKELTKEIIEKMYADLNKLDLKVGQFTELQVEGGENKRTFHDWLLAMVFGEKWLAMLSTFMLSASREQLDDQIAAIKTVINDRKNDLLN